MCTLTPGSGKARRARVWGPTHELTLLALPPALSLERRAAAARELLLAALEDLSQEQLKRFRHKLRDAPLDGRSIPWGRLERADAVDLAAQLTHFYGPEPALDVVRKTLKRADVRDVAARLKEQQLQRERASLGPYPPLLPSWAESGT